METPKVSLLLPVYNSFSLERSDGKRLLPVAMASLLNQSFRDFELIILDNQSTDDTAVLCKDYAKADPRVRYVLDDRKRFAEEAITYLGSMATGQYSMIVNDDDIWESTYLERAVTYLNANPDVDLVYGTALFINIHNLLTGDHTPSQAELYDESVSAHDRLLRYLRLRNVIPINFGLFKTQVFKNILPYEDFDTLKSNVDNVFMSKFFLLGYKATYLPDMLFFYRRKRRKITPSLFAPNMPQLDRPNALWLFYVNHQILFFRKIISMIEKSESAPIFSKSRQRILQTFIEQSVFELFGLTQELKKQELHAESRKLKRVIAYYRDTLKGKVDRNTLVRLAEYAHELEPNDESEHWKNQVVTFLNNEQETPPSYSFSYSWKRRLSMFPVVKKILIILRAAYLNVRHFHVMTHIRKLHRSAQKYEAK